MRYTLQEVHGVLQDLVAHQDVIISGGQPAAADRFAVAYGELADRLLEWPLSGRQYGSPDPALNHLRVGKLAAPFHHYSVFYTVEGRVVRVLAVIHAAMGEASRRRLLQGRGGAG